VTAAAGALLRLAVAGGLAGPVRAPTLTRVLVAGSAPAAASALTALTRPDAALRSVGRCVTDPRTDPDAVRRVAGAARAAGADAVLIADPATFGPGPLRRLAWSLEGSGLALLLAGGPADVSTGRLRAGSVAGLPLLQVDPTCFTGSRRVVKELVDRVGAAVLLVALAPLIGCIALAVRVADPGPVLFRQSRVGRHGARFTMLKFRSMRVDAERWRPGLEARNDHPAGVLFKMRRDPRITTVGRWIRRLSLDELPQLVNVLRGEMSLVGPRPPLPSEVERYESDALRRLMVKPGMTGLWQVSGRADLTWAESVRLDLSYVDNWSIGLDLRILGRTLQAVVGGDGAR
jgi:exopolysaccharide biosynthesis polyprenyl glycosylphosphotransferase